MTAIVSIVDDDESVREATKGLVRSLGYGALTFSSAEEFLASDRVRHTACLITDLHMPGLDGLEMQRRLIEQGLKVPVIFITAYPEEHQRQRALENGAICFIAKPCREEHLIACLERALRSGTTGPAKQTG